MRHHGSKAQQGQLHHDDVLVSPPQPFYRPAPVLRDMELTGQAAAFELRAMLGK